MPTRCAGRAPGLAAAIVLAAGLLLTAAAVRPAGAGAHGEAVTTHGQDSEALLGASPPAGVSGVSLLVGGAERAPVCAGTNHVRLFYAHPADQPDNVATHAATIRTLLRQANHTLNADGVASGGVTTDYRVRCASGQPSVDSFEVPAGMTNFNAVLQALRDAGLETADTKHLMFFESVGGCGEGSYPNGDNRPIAENGANDEGWAVVWGSPGAGCWSENAVLHELGHTMGAVSWFNPPAGPPHNTGRNDILPGLVEGGGSHCVDGLDVMCTQTENGWTPVNTFCTDRVHFDCGYDDYFHTDPPVGNWLFDHWNIGHPRNLYLAFGTGGEDPDPGDPSALSSCLAAADAARARAIRRAKRAHRRSLRKAKRLGASAAANARRRATRRKKKAIKRVNRVRNLAVTSCRQRFL